MDFASRPLVEGLQSELECARCKDITKSPATLCEKVHNIRNKCRPLLGGCPTCRNFFHEARNCVTESKAKLTVYDPTIPATDCGCPISVTSGLQCSWSGKLEDIKKHIIQNHDKRIADKSGKFSMPFTNVTPRASYSLVISTLGEVFMRKAQIRDDNFYLVVMYIGPQKNASRYKYTFTISKKNSVESISICQKARSFIENCDDIYRSRNCIKLHYEVVSNFLLDSSHDLPNVMEISKV
jgi:hypothetical protein